MGAQGDFRSAVAEAEHCRLIIVIDAGEHISAAPTGVCPA